MARIDFSRCGDTPFQRLLGHTPEVMTRWAALEQALVGSPGLDAALKEQVRRTLAFANGCRYCMAKGPPDRNQADMRASLAVGFAQLVGQDHRSITGAQFDVLRDAFSETEIAELVALICFFTAAQMFGAVLDLGPED
jgi:alkylhydroperoxidase family enzyme